MKQAFLMFGFDRLLNFMKPTGYVHLDGEYFLDLRNGKRTRITPNLFIVGAQKCGTSSLHAYLDEHPEIFMSKPRKEPGYYVPWPVIRDYYQRKNTPFRSRPDLLKRGMLKGYKNEKIFGESSTFYSNGTYNIKKEQFLSNGVSLDDVRIIYLMKNPIERIISHYLHALRYNDFNGDINSFVQSNEEAIRISEYGKQIATYFDYLHSDQILPLKFESLTNHPQSILNKVYQFLHVNSYDNKEFKVLNAAPKSQQMIRSAVDWDPDVYKMIISAIEKDRQVLGDFVDLEEFHWNVPNSCV